MDPAAGTWPIPAHEPHVDSDTVAPAASRSVSSPSRAIVSRIRWLPGKRTKDTEGCTRWPRSTSVTDDISCHEPFVHEPTITCSTWVPATSSMGTTRSGEPGSATSGVILERSSSSWSSYSASSSGAAGRQSPGRPSRVRKERVTSSDGKTLVVRPSSAPMLAMVMRWAASRLFMPGPAYSKIFPAPPRTLSRRSSSRITSFAVTQGWSSPVSHTRTISGIVKKYGPPPIATATSRLPAPIASMPAAPQSGVWLSEPSSVWPGMANVSMCTWWQMPLPGLEKTAPYFRAAVCM